jgi:uncharacterized caspase-like protein
MRQRTAYLISVIACALALLQSAPAQAAEKRVALVIGNSTYAHAPSLRNPASDARAIADLLTKAGFDQVTLKLDLAYDGMRLALRDFGLAARSAEVAVVYFAGHGLEFGGENYLVPVDAALKSDSSVAFETATLSAVLEAIRPASRLRLVILDACRSNPLATRMEPTGGRTRSIPRGLGRIEPTGDVLVAYAAKAGTVAADGSGRHSPYAEALLANLTTPGLDIRLVLGRVRDLVLAKTNGAQEPFVYGSLGGANVALVAPKAGAAAAPSDDPDAKAARDYELAEKIGTKEAWDAFLAAHSSGFHADLARAQRARLAVAAPSVALAKPSPAPPQPSEATPEPLPADLPADVLRALETSPLFANAVPVLAETYHIPSVIRTTPAQPQEMNHGYRKTVVRTLRPGLLKLDVEQVVSGKYGSTSKFSELVAANGLIEVSRKSSGLLNRRLIGINKMTGRVFPVEVGNQFSYAATYRDEVSEMTSHTSETTSCKVTKKYDGKVFHGNLTGLAYLAECNTNAYVKINFAAFPGMPATSGTSTEARMRSPVFFEALGLWLDVDPTSPKESLTRTSKVTLKAFGKEDISQSTTSATLKAFTLAR